jgi:hypothetical protein
LKWIRQLPDGGSCRVSRKDGPPELVLRRAVVGWWRGRAAGRRAARQVRVDERFSNTLSRTSPPPLSVALKSAKLSSPAARASLLLTVLPDDPFVADQSVAVFEVSQRVGRKVSRVTMLSGSPSSLWTKPWANSSGRYRRAIANIWSWVGFPISTSSASTVT